MAAEIFHQIHSGWSNTVTALLPWMPVLLLATLIEQLHPARKVKPLLVLANAVYMPVALTLGGLIVYPCVAWLNGKLPYDLVAFGDLGSEPKKKMALWVAYLLIFDFLYYWFHRAQHRIRFMWRYHMVHHSDTNVSALSVGRHHWLEEGFRYFFITAPLMMIVGANSMPLWVTGVIVYNGILMHWNVPLRFGPLERVLVTPAYHRVHHSIEEKHFDKNFGLFTQWWDFVFGTRYLPAHQEFPRTGIENFPERSTLALLLPWPILMRKRSDQLPAAGDSASG